MNLSIPFTFPLIAPVTLETIQFIQINLLSLIKGNATFLTLVPHPI